MAERLTRQIVTAGLLALLSCSAGYANSIITTPAGLMPGTQYQLVFITSDTFNAELATISTYNTDVTNEAALNAALASFDSANGVTWTDIGSTASVNADVNAPAPGLVYDLEGDEEASLSDLLYSGPLLDNNGIEYTELGTSIVGLAWTGSLSDGAGDSGETLGSSSVEDGKASSSSLWLANGGAKNTNIAHLYALSSVITVPAATPEPGTVVLLTSGLTLLAGFASSKRRTRRASTRF